MKSIIHILLLTLFFLESSHTAPKPLTELDENALIHRIFSDEPETVAAEFERRNTPTALAWRAYMAYAGITPLKGNGEQKAQELLLKAAVKEKEERIKRNGRSHLLYIEVKEGVISSGWNLNTDKGFFELLRRIIDNGERQYSLPCKFAYRHGRFIMKSFGSTYWANAQDGKIEICGYNQNDMSRHKDIKAYVNKLSSLSGIYNVIRGSLLTTYINHLKEIQKEMSIFPEDFTNVGNPETQKYLAFWATKTPSNTYEYKQLTYLKEKARQAFKQQLIGKFEFTEDKAEKHATGMVSTLEYGWLDRFNHSFWEKYYTAPLFNLVQQHPSTHELKRFIKEFSPKQSDIRTSIRYAIFNNLEETALTLYKHLSPSGYQGTYPQEEPLFFHAVYLPSLLKKMLSKKDTNINQANWFGKTALMYAIQSHNLESIRLLLKKGADINQATILGPENTYLEDEWKGIEAYQRTPLMYAAWQGTPEIIHLLIKHGANIHAKDSNEDTALDYLLRNDGIPRLERTHLMDLLG